MSAVMAQVAPISDSELLDSIAAIAIGVPGLNDEAIYSVGSGLVEGVTEFPDDLALGAFPAVLVLPDDREVIPGNWERTTYRIELSIWVPDQKPRAEAYRQLIDPDGALRQAFRDHAKGGLRHPSVQSVLITGSTRPEGRQYPRGEKAPWYLVRPYTIEVKVNQAVTYRPA